MNNTLELFCDYIKNNSQFAKQVSFTRSGYNPFIGYLKIDALNKSDYPHGIPENSVYVIFKINLEHQSIERHSSGHCYISEKEKHKYPYLVMRNILEIAETNYNVKKFRKCKFKKTDILTAKHITDYFDNVLNCVDNYTGGYPYK